jgi:hypothetical protein
MSSTVMSLFLVEVKFLVAEVLILSKFNCLSKVDMTWYEGSLIHMRKAILLHLSCELVTLCSFLGVKLQLIEMFLRFICFYIIAAFKNIILFQWKCFQ